MGRFLCGCVPLDQGRGFSRGPQAMTRLPITRRKLLDSPRPSLEGEFHGQSRWKQDSHEATARHACVVPHQRREIAAPTRILSRRLVGLKWRGPAIKHSRFVRSARNRSLVEHLSSEGWLRGQHETGTKRPPLTGAVFCSVFFVLIVQFGRGVIVVLQTFRIPVIRRHTSFLYTKSPFFATLSLLIT